MLRSKRSILMVIEQKITYLSYLLSNHPLHSVSPSQETDVIIAWNTLQVLNPSQSPEGGKTRDLNWFWP